MKKQIVILVGILAVSFLLTGCGKSVEQERADRQKAVMGTQIKPLPKKGTKSYLD